MNLGHRLPTFVNKILGTVNLDFIKEINLYKFKQFYDYMLVPSFNDTCKPAKMYFFTSMAAYVMHSCCYIHGR